MKLIEKVGCMLPVMKVHADAVGGSRTIAEDPLLKCFFRITIPGMPTGIGFQKVSGLSREVEVIEYLEGLFTHAHKLPGREKVGELTCERGVYASEELKEYYEETLTNGNLRTTLTIDIMNRFGEVKKTYTLAEAWCSKWEATDLDATSSDVGIEKITIQFERFL